MRTYTATFALVGWLALVGCSILSGVVLVAVHPQHGALKAS
jgi:hypothetical protein